MGITINKTQQTQSHEKSLGCCYLAEYVLSIAQIKPRSENITWALHWTFKVTIILTIDANMSFAYDTSKEYNPVMCNKKEMSYYLTL